MPAFAEVWLKGQGERPILSNRLVLFYAGTRERCECVYDG